MFSHIKLTFHRIISGQHFINGLKRAQKFRCERSLYLLTISIGSRGGKQFAKPVVYNSISKNASEFKAPPCFPSGTENNPASISRFIKSK